MNIIVIIGLALVAGLFLIPVVYLVLWARSVLRERRAGPPTEVESESWMHGEREVSFVYPKGSRPGDATLDEIKRNIGTRVDMVLNRIQETGEYSQDIKSGITLESVSFPMPEDEDDFDFTLDFAFNHDADSFLSATFRNGKVDTLSAGD